MKDRSNRSSQRRPQRPQGQCAVRVNISLPPALRDVAPTVATHRGFQGISDYVQACIRRDAAALGMDQFQLSN